MNIHSICSAVCILGLSFGLAKADLIFDFDTGDGTTPSLDGWTVIMNGDPGIDGQPLIQLEASEQNRLVNAPVITTAWDRDGSAGGFAGDSAHPHLIMRSPSFSITEAGNITWRNAGGTGASLAPVLSAGTYNTGAQGVALVRASDGVMIASAVSNTSGIADGSIDPGALLNDGLGYYLEVVDTRSGGWGYSE
jgi:hypothetical protein